MCPSSAGAGILLKQGRPSSLERSSSPLVLRQLALQAGTLCIASLVPESRRLLVTRGSGSMAAGGLIMAIRGVGKDVCQFGTKLSRLRAVGTLGPVR
jgi:hypothetical protein